MYKFFLDGAKVRILNEKIVTLWLIFYIFARELYI